MWGNESFKCNNNTLFSKEFIDARFIQISDFIDENGHFRNGIFNRLNKKHHYFRVIDML